jgi:hypothetical protein
MFELNIVSNNFSSAYNEGVAVVMQSPIRRTINMRLDNRITYEKHFGMSILKEHPSYLGNFFLSFPTILFRIHYIKKIKNIPFQLHVVFLNNKNEMCIPPLPNIDQCMRVCLPLPMVRFSDVETLCDSVITTFWSSEFNSGMANSCEQFYKIGSLFGDHRKWRRKTKANPDWIPNRGLVSVNRYFTKNFLYGVAFKNAKK